VSSGPSISGIPRHPSPDALTSKPIVTLPAKLLSELGVSRDAKARGLKALEQAGLVHVSRSKGKAARIELRKTKGEN
jgi:DNA-binding transcriptional ArsR family regulator